MEEAKTTQAEAASEFARELETAPEIKRPEIGEKVKGQIIAISDTAVLVDCGMKSEAIIDPAELDGQQVGDEIEATVTELEPLTLSLKLVGNKLIDENLRNAFENEIPVSGKITRAIKGGFDVDVAGKRAFLPLRHLDLHFVRDTSGYIGETFDFKIIEYNPEQDKFVVSRSELLKKEKAEKAERVWEQISVGAILKGKVSSIQSFGAFIDLGGVDGLVHISELSQGFINHPSEVLSLGQEVTVKVIKADKEKNRISLSMKELAPNPWEHVEEKYKSGDRFSGVVVRRADFGLFVEIEPGIDGLLHLSQLPPDTDLDDPRYAIGQTVDGWIRSVDLQNRRVSLTLRESKALNKWDSLPEKYAVNSVFEGKIEESTKFGVFVELEPGLTGLMPLSELRRLGFKNPDKAFEVGSTIEVRITALDKERRRISLIPQEVPEHPAPESGKARRKKRKGNKKDEPTAKENNGSITEFGARLAAALGEKNIS